MTAKGFRPRLAEKTDIESILRVERESFPRPWNRRSFEEELESESSRVWVAGRAEGSAIGYLCYRLIADEMEILRIGVALGLRGRGVATRLLDDGFHEARADGARTAVLEVRSSNALALGLYRKLNFSPIGKRPGYFPDTGEAALILTKDLEKGPESGREGGIYEHESRY